MGMRNAPQGTIRSALRHPDFRLLLAGQATSQIGDFLYNVALVAVVFTRTGSAVWAGVTAAARVIPMVALGPFGGLIADRFNRRGVLLACDVFRLLVMLALAVAAARNLPVVLCPVLAALATAAAAPALPAIAAVTPRLVPDADLPGANAIRSALSASAIIIGPSVGGVLLLFTPALAFVWNAVTFGISVTCTLAVRNDAAFAVPRAAGTAGPPAPRRRGLFSQLALGAAALRAHPAALRLLGADMMCSFAYGLESVLFVMVAMDAGLDSHGYGFMFASVGIGGLIGTSLAGRAARLPYRPVLIGALAVAGLPLLILPVAHWAALVLILPAAGGAGAILVEVMMDTGLQRVLPEEAFGTAYGLAIPASVGCIGIGSLAAPWLNDALGTGGALLAGGALVVGYIIFLIRDTGRRATPATVADAAGLLAA